MAILDRYLFNAIAGATGLVILVLLALGSLIEFVGQLDQIGEGNYDMLSALQFVALKIPRLVTNLLPASVLIGALLGLGALASSSELIVMRAAGVSAVQLAKAVGVTGIFIAVCGGIVSEFLAPQMDLYARQMRAVAMSGDADMAGASAWLRDGDLIFNVRPPVDGVDQGGVFMFRMGKPGTLAGMGRGDSAQSDDATWVLNNFRESKFSAAGVKIGWEIEREKISQLSDLLALTAVRDSSLAGRELWAYINYLQANGLDSARYEIVFWSRIAAVVGVAVMCVLALPFVSGSLRSSGAGARMVIGVLIGLGYFLLNKTLADSAAVFDLQPFVVAWLPTLMLGVIAAIGLLRLR